MSAAVIRPTLFDHLFASQPGRDQNSVTATLYSLAFHATVVVLAVWLSVALKPTPDRRTVDEVTPIYIALPPQASPVEPAGGAPQAGAGRGAVYTLPSVPLPGIPELTSQTDPEFAQPGAPAGEVMRNSGSAGAPGEAQGPARSDGFRILSVAPAMVNEPLVRQALVRSYPVMLREAGIGGLTLVWVLIDEDGRVVRTELKESSGYPALDEAAIKIAPIMRFSPAMNRDQRVKVWVSIPVRFRAD